MKSNTVKLLSSVALMSLFSTAFAGSITDIKVSVLSNNQRVVKVKFDKDVVEPTGFITANPARIALDFAGTDLALKQSSLSFNDSLLNQVVAAQGNNHARILLGLSQEAQYNAQIKGDEVWIYVTESVSTNTAPQFTSDNTASQAKYANSINQATSGGSLVNIDFRKGANGSGIVEYKSNYSGNPVVKTQSDRLIITLKNHILETKDQKKLDVTDFATPIRNIEVRRLGNDTQIVIRNQGSWGHKISGSNGNQIIQISPERNVAALGVTERKKTNFKGKTISLDFQNVDVRTVLQILAKESNTNIVASDSVQGQMTLSLKDVPWDQALDLVLDARGLDMKRHGNIINVAPRKEMLQKSRDELTARREIEELGPLLSQTFQLKYKNVEEFKEILKLDQSSNSNNSRSILSGRGSALIDPATNTLIVTDNQYVMQKFQKLIEELDVPARQVMVESRIVEASEGVSRELGVKFGFSRTGRTAWGSTLDSAINNYNVGVGSSSATEALLGPNVNLPISAATNAVALVRSFSSGALGLELSALEEDNRSKTISTPRVLTQDRKEAEIRQGYQIPYTTYDNGTTATAFKDAVMSLKVTPRITPDNKIILDVVINKDEADYTNTNILGEPGIQTKYLKTQAMIEDGGTLVVGGIYQEIYGNTIKKVPLLGDIPVVGNLFKSRNRNQSRNELLFFITPRIMGQENSVLRY